MGNSLNRRIYITPIGKKLDNNKIIYPISEGMNDGIKNISISFTISK